MLNIKEIRKVPLRLSAFQTERPKIASQQPLVMFEIVAVIPPNKDSKLRPENVILPLYHFQFTLRVSFRPQH